MTLILTPGKTPLAQLDAFWRSDAPARLDPLSRPAVEASAVVIHKAARGDTPVYGVNTGFCKLASVRIAPQDTETLQRNLILSHCCGVGDALEPATIRS